MARTDDDQWDVTTGVGWLAGCGETPAAVDVAVDSVLRSRYVTATR